MLVYISWREPGAFWVHRSIHGGGSLGVAALTQKMKRRCRWDKQMDTERHESGKTTSSHTGIWALHPDTNQSTEQVTGRTPRCKPAIG